MQDDPRYRVEVEVSPRFLAHQSTPDEGRYAFAYSIRIHNAGAVPARLIARHWQITDTTGAPSKWMAKAWSASSRGCVRARPFNTHLA